jgi:hypothetical protein
MGVRIGNREEHLLIYLARRRAATTSQIAGRWFPSSKRPGETSIRYAQKRLQLLAEAGYLKQFMLPMGEQAPKQWEACFCLSDLGRRIVASLTGAELTRIPTASLDIRTRHVVSVGHALDALQLDDAHTEVTIPGVKLIADAVTQTSKGLVCIEVDRSNCDLSEKAQKYGQLMRGQKGVKLVIVTHRPGSVERTFAGLPHSPIILTFDQVKKGACEWVRRELA